MIPPFRSFAAALVLLCGAAHAEPGGREALKNGADVRWQIDPRNDGARLGLSIPAFAQWAADGFDQPLTIRMRSDALAVIDAWELAIYRLGDTEFERPLRRFRGPARTLHTPLLWSGETDDGPALRPGETVVTRLSVRDVSGNIDRSPPQKTLVARYMMRAERRKIAVLDTERASLLEMGSAPLPRRIPTRGYLIDMMLRDWEESEAPYASGVPLRPSGDEWVLSQFVPTGSHDIVVQSTRPIIGGVRAVPVGVVPVAVPPDVPLVAGVKGTGKLKRLPGTTDAQAPSGFIMEGQVSGAEAISRVLTNREGAEDRLAFALLDADRPVTLVKDDRKHRSFLVYWDAGTVSWPGAGRAQASLREPTDPATHRIALTFTVPAQPELILPHTDVTVLDLSIRGEDDALLAFRDYFPNSAEGRLLLSASILERLAQTPDAVLDVVYEIPTFAPSVRVTKAIRDGGGSRDESWRDTEEWSLTASGVRRKDEGLLERILDWIF